MQMQGMSESEEQLDCEEEFGERLAKVVLKQEIQDGDWIPSPLRTGGNLSSSTTRGDILSYCSAACYEVDTIFFSLFLYFIISFSRIYTYKDHSLQLVVRRPYSGLMFPLILFIYLL